MPTPSSHELTWISDQYIVIIVIQGVRARLHHGGRESGTQAGQGEYGDYGSDNKSWDYGSVVR